MVAVGWDFHWAVTRSPQAASPCGLDFLAGCWLHSRQISRETGEQKPLACPDLGVEVALHLFCRIVFVRAVTRARSATRGLGAGTVSRQAASFGFEKSSLPQTVVSDLSREVNDVTLTWQKLTTIFLKNIASQ